MKRFEGIINAIVAPRAHAVFYNKNFRRNYKNLSFNITSASILNYPEFPDRWFFCQFLLSQSRLFCKICYHLWGKMAPELDGVDNRIFTEHLGLTPPCLLCALFSPCKWNLSRKAFVSFFQSILYPAKNFPSLKKHFYLMKNLLFCGGCGFTMKTT